MSGKKNQTAEITASVLKRPKASFTTHIQSLLMTPIHSLNELRFIDVGTSDKIRLLIVVYTERGKRIRIISARKATATERRKYETENG